MQEPSKLPAPKSNLFEIYPPPLIFGNHWFSGRTRPKSLNRKALQAKYRKQVSYEAATNDFLEPGSTYLLLLWGKRRSEVNEKICFRCMATQAYVGPTEVNSHARPPLLRLSSLAYSVCDSATWTFGSNLYSTESARDMRHTALLQ